jgi:VWFA-related protein
MAAGMHGGWKRFARSSATSWRITPRNDHRTFYLKSMRSRHHVQIAAAPLVLIAFLVTFAQTPPAEKPKTKEFGSSLKRLKWDPSKKAASEIKNEKNGEEVDDVIRVETRLVVADVLVLDSQGRPVAGLTQNDFIVIEDNQPQNIAHFSLGDDRSTERSIVLIIDHSWSQLPYLRTSIQAAETLVDKLGPKDRMAIVTDDVSLLLNFTRDKSKIKKALEELRLITIPPTGGMLQQSDGNVPPTRRKLGHSDQFSALLATVRELVSAEDMRPIIIFQADGDELNVLQPPNLHRYDRPLSANSSDNEKKRWQDVERILRPRVKQYSIDDVYAAVQKSRATVYSVIPGVQFLGMPESEYLERAKQAVSDSASASGLSRNAARGMSKEDLAQVAASRLDMQSAMATAATVSGGWTAFLEEPKQAEKIYSQILADVNSRYVIGYYPTNKSRDGSRRSVLLQVRDHPEYKVTGRKAYYAPGPD